MEVQEAGNAILICIDFRYTSFNEREYGRCNFPITRIAPERSVDIWYTVGDL